MWSSTHRAFHPSHAGRVHQKVQGSKVEAARRGRQNWNEERSKKIEVRFAQWIGLEYRETIHEKIQRKVRYLFWDRAQIEEGGNGGTVQQRGQGRMEICG